MSLAHLRNARGRAAGGNAVAGPSGGGNQRLILQMGNTENVPPWGRVPDSPTTLLG